MVFLTHSVAPSPSALSFSLRRIYIILYYYIITCRYPYALFMLYYYNIIIYNTVLYYTIPRKAAAAASLFRPSDRICGRDEKEELHRGERHKRARIIDVPNA